MAPATASPTPDVAGAAARPPAGITGLRASLNAGLQGRRLLPPRVEVAGRVSLTTRILLVNILALALLAGSVFYLDSYRKQLLQERYKLARSEAQIAAEAIAGASRSRQDAVLTQIGKEQRLRLRLFGPDGRLVVDSFALDEPAYTLGDPAADTWDRDIARALDRAIDALVGANPVPLYREPESIVAADFPELRRARNEGLTQIELYQAPDRTPVISTAAPVGLDGAMLLTTRNASDITERVRAARTTLALLILAAGLVTVLLSLFLARTIIRPLRDLATAAVRVRQGRGREVVVPRMAEREDEIGVLARAVADMTDALRSRIDAVDSFAADVAHEIKNPLASLRSAVEGLARIADPDLRAQLTTIALHDLTRLDRLITEISDASRIDAELSRAAFEEVDLAALVAATIGAREDRGIDDGARLDLAIGEDAAALPVAGVPLRLERVLENLIDNAMSFSPANGTVCIRVAAEGAMAVAEVLDQGPGIPAEEREKVFERFHSLRPADEAFGGHSGLGLAIARAIAEGHDGTLSVHDRPDGRTGACLRLALPLLPG